MKYVAENYPFIYFLVRAYVVLYFHLGSFLKIDWFKLVFVTDFQFIFSTIIKTYQDKRQSLGGFLWRYMSIIPQCPYHLGFPIYIYSKIIWFGLHLFHYHRRFVYMGQWSNRPTEYSFMLHKWWIGENRTQLALLSF